MAGPSAIELRSKLVHFWIDTCLRSKLAHWCTARLRLMRWILAKSQVKQATRDARDLVTLLALIDWCHSQLEKYVAWRKWLIELSQQMNASIPTRRCSVRVRLVYWNSPPSIFDCWRTAAVSRCSSWYKTVRNCWLGNILKEFNTGVNTVLTHSSPHNFSVFK